MGLIVLSHQSSLLDVKDHNSKKKTELSPFCRDELAQFGTEATMLAGSFKYILMRSLCVYHVELGRWITLC